MVGARAVLLGAAAELAPHLDQDPVGEAPRLEVALEGEDGVAGVLQVRRRVLASFAWVS